MSKNKKQKKGVIYSTNPNFNFEYEEEEIINLEPKEQLLKIFIDKNRNGKTAVIIKNFIGDQSQLKSLAKYLKQKCSVGGSVKENEIIIQGDIREKIIELLVEKGYNCKKIGG